MKTGLFGMISRFNGSIFTNLVTEKKDEFNIKK